MASMTEARKQAVSGLTPPQFREVLIREVWPTVAATPGVSSLGLALMRTIVLAPVGWLLLAPFYFRKVLPFISKRYTLTNRRLMIRRGLKPTPARSLDLAAIDDVQVAPGSVSDFFRSGTLHVISGGQTALRLAGVPEPESFRRAILNARTAWAPRPPAPPGSGSPGIP